MPILTALGSSTSRAYGQNGNILIPGNSGIITSGSSYTLPYTSGMSVNVLVIAGGGGGGGGSFRNASNAGYNVGAGGGGAGGNAYATSISVLPGQTISFSIGAAGSAGSGRDGGYSSNPGSPGGVGGNGSVTINGTVVAAVTGGGNGILSPDSTAGYAGGLSTGTQATAPNAGGAGTSTNQFTGQGGYGGAGYTLNTTIGLAIGSIIGYGNPGYTYTAGGASSVSGTIYGAGGGGGGTNQSDQQSGANAIPAAGTVGAVFIWWGY